jgi:DNA-directed RNA polymerase subunit RPC12/RpoP
MRTSYEKDNVVLRKCPKCGHMVLMQDVGGIIKRQDIERNQAR